VRLFEAPVRRRRVHKGRAVDFWVDTVRLPSGGTATREYLGHPGAVAVVAVKKGGRDPELLFVRQYRYPVKKVTWELPAGKLDPKERVLSCVHRELEEETGFRAGKVRRMLSYWPTPAFADEVIHIFEATRLRPGSFRPDEDEFLEVESIPLSRALRMIRRGLIQDSKTIIGLLSYSRWFSR
jgi:ADP-ribose pyrophosphatase